MKECRRGMDFAFSKSELNNISVLPHTSARTPVSNQAKLASNVGEPR